MSFLISYSYRLRITSVHGTITSGQCPLRLLFLQLQQFSCLNNGRCYTPRFTSFHPGCTCQISRQVTLGSPNKSLRWPGWMTGLWLWGGGGGYEYFLSGYMLLDCNLTGLVGCSDILPTLVRLRVTTRIRA